MQFWQYFSDTFSPQSKQQKKRSVLKKISNKKEFKETNTSIKGTQKTLENKQTIKKLKAYFHAHGALYNALLQHLTCGYEI